MSETIDVCVIDDDDAVLDSTCGVLERAGFSVRIYVLGGDFLADLDRGAEFRCIVCDVKMPGLSGLELQRLLRERRVTAPVILITGHGDVAMAVEALKAGAADFIEKPFDAERLVETIRLAIAAGSRHQAQRQARADIASRVNELTPRQREVMALVVEGYSNKEIGARLGISARTVETYRLWVMERTGARNLAELVRMAMRLETTDE